MDPLLLVVKQNTLSFKCDTSQVVNDKRHMKCELSNPIKAEI